MNETSERYVTIDQLFDFLLGNETIWKSSIEEAKRIYKE